MHPKMMMRNQQMFQQKRQDPDRGVIWAKQHVQGRFTQEEKEELLGRPLRKKLT